MPIYIVYSTQISIGWASRVQDWGEFNPIFLGRGRTRQQGGVRRRTKKRRVGSDEPLPGKKLINLNHSSKIFLVLFI